MKNGFKAEESKIETKIFLQSWNKIKSAKRN